VHKNCKK